MGGAQIRAKTLAGKVCASLSSSPSLLGEGDRAAKRRGGGAKLTPLFPSTVLRTVPLPEASSGRI
jgi:hypothetical protein